VALVSGFGSLPIHIADVKGFFRNHGLAATVLENTSTASFGPGLGKQFDFVLSTPLDFLSAAAKGIDITAVTGMSVNSATSPNNVLVTKDPAIRSMADLKGKRVGVISLAGTSYGAIVYGLTQAGMAKSDVTFVPTPFASMEDQLEAGNLDAALSTTPYWSSTLAKGYRIVADVPFAVAGEGSPNSFYSSSTQYAKANPKQVEGFRAAMGDAVNWIKQNPDQARAELVTWLKLPAPVVAASPLPVLDTTMTVSKIEPYLPIARASGQITGTIPDLGKVVWPSGTP
jgi:NitT/TauT family transport system substrate-binding protein